MSCSNHLLGHQKFGEQKVKLINPSKFNVHSDPFKSLYFTKTNEIDNSSLELALNQAIRTFNGILLSLELE